MFKMLFKFMLTFSVSFIILSFRVSDKPLFNHISEFTGPLGLDVQNSLQRSVQRSLDKTKVFGKDLFKNADPQYLKDTLGSSQSARNKKKEFVLEELRRDEVKQLDDLINKN